MFFIIEPPTIVDNTNIQYCPNQQLLTPENIEFLKSVDNLRIEFKKTIQQDRLKSLVQNQASLLNDKDTLDAYLKSNVEMMKILIMKPQQHPKFIYKLFLSKGSPNYSTDKINSIEESCGCEIVMVRYIYALAFQQNSIPIVNRIKYSMLSTPDAINQGDILQVLKLLSVGIQPYQRLCNVMDDLLKSLVTQQQKLIPELKMTVIFSFKLIMECNINFIYLEQLRPSKEYEFMSKVCRASYSKLNDAYTRLQTQAEDINSNIIEYCYSSMRYFRLYGLWSILMQNERDILLEKYQRKGYNILTSENHKIAKEIMQIIQTTAQKPNEYDQFTIQYANNSLTKHIQKSLNVYGQHAQIHCSNPEDLFMSLDQSHDYVEIMKLQQQQ